MAAWVFNSSRNTWYRLDQLLDRGGEGEVWLGVWHPSGVEIAVKVIHSAPGPQAQFTSWYQDQDIHRRCLGHPAVVQTYDQFRSPEGHWVLVMERALANLDTLVASGRRQSPLTVCSIAHQVLSALEHLHGQNI